MRATLPLLLILFMLCLSGVWQCVAEEGRTLPNQLQVGSSGEEALRQWTIPMPTFGGLQVWTDHSYREGYRIQHNTVTITGGSSTTTIDDGCGVLVGSARIF